MADGTYHVMMKFICLLALVVLLGSCSTRKENTSDIDYSATINPKDLPLDSLLRLRHYRAIIHMFSEGYDQRDNEKYGKLLHGAWIQTIGERYPLGEISCVSVGLVQNADMPRMLSLPRWWQTSTGIHVDMSLDSVQLLNNGAFTIVSDTAGIYIDSWDNGALTNMFTEVHFALDSGASFPADKISSQELLDQGLDVKVKGFIIWQPEYWQYRIRGTHQLQITE